MSEAVNFPFADIDFRLKLAIYLTLTNNFETKKNITCCQSPSFILVLTKII